MFLSSLVCWEAKQHQVTATLDTSESGKQRQRLVHSMVATSNPLARGKLYDRQWQQYVGHE
jgi:hypothetical protein